MKKIKRNAVIVTVLLFVCAAVYLNWSYNQKAREAASAGTPDDVSVLEDGGDGALDAESLAGDGGLYYSVTAGETAGTGDGTEAKGPDSAPSPEAPASEPGPYDEYFADVRYQRQQARDEAADTLAAVAEADNASQETIDQALSSMAVLAERTVKEAELENLIRAKGFVDAVVYLTDGHATVTVACDGGLTQTAVAKITDVIVSETDVPADGLTVVEIK